MLALLSPAKSLDYDRPLPDLDPTPIRFAPETAELAAAAKKLKAADLKRLMHISDALAELNAARYADFHGQPERPAIYAFSGDVYIGFEARTLPEESIAFAQHHVRILSGLYGLLRPLDNIRPYRLEMGTRWGGKARNLYAYWGSRIAGLVAQDMEEIGTLADKPRQQRILESGEGPHPAAHPRDRHRLPGRRPQRPAFQQLRGQKGARDDGPLYVRASSDGP
jgi:cytoplasmic iron level regulating protein YaaA (DUF328/UPF0246 family)